MLRVDPRARDRLAAIIANLREHIDEARLNGWEGEVQGLRTSLSAAAAKMVSLDRAARATAANDPVNLGMPVLRLHREQPQGQQP